MKRITVLLLILLIFPAATLLAGGVATMDKEELKGLLGSPDLVLLDVRTGRDWNSSEFKIKGAVRLEGGDISTVVAEIPKDRTIVLYCA